jgi:peptide/nickel transport system substrate-binding protein
MTPATTGAGASGATEQRSANQVLRYGVTSVPVSMSIEATETAREQYYFLYDTVTTSNAAHEVLPWAATKWEMVNPTTWRMYLRNDLTFSNGDKLTADDVVFTAKFVLDNKTSPITQLGTLTDIKAVDDYTVDFISKTNDVSILVGLAYLVIMPKNYFNSVGRQGFAVKPIGSGPYVLSEFTSGQLAHYTLRKEPHPFRKPALTEIIVQAIPENSTAIAGLKTGSLDFVGRNFSADEITGLQRDGFVIESAPEPASGLFVLFPKTETDQRDLPTKNLKVRQALNYAIDREALSKAFYGGRAKPTGQLVGPGSPFYDPSIQAYPYDPVKAKQLLAEAGYPNGFTLQNGLDYSTAFVIPDVIVTLQGYLRAVGVNVDLTLNEQGIYVEKFRGTRPKGDLYASSLYDPNGFNSTIRGYFSCDTLYNTIGNVWYCNKQWDQLHVQAASEPDLAKRTTILRQAARIIATDDVCCIFVLFTSSYRVHSAKVKGFQWGDLIWNMDPMYKID